MKVQRLISLYFDSVWTLGYAFCYLHPLWVAWQSEHDIFDKMIIVMAVLIFQTMSTLCLLIYPLIASLFIFSAMFFGWITALDKNFSLFEADAIWFWWSMFNIVMVVGAADKSVAFGPIRNVFFRHQNNVL